MAFDTTGIVPETFYTVTLTGPIELTPDNFAAPGDVVRLRGDLVVVHAENITAAVETVEG